MAGTVPGVRDIKSNYTDSTLKKCASREEDMHVDQQLRNTEVNRMMTVTVRTATTYLMFTLSLTLIWLPLMCYNIYPSPWLNMENLFSRPILQMRK